jgi:hypothetical protein
LKTKSTAPQKGGPANPKWQSSLAQSDEADSPQVTPKVTIQPGPLGPSTATAADATITPEATDISNRQLAMARDIQAMASFAATLHEVRTKSLWREWGFRSFHHWAVSTFKEDIGTAISNLK